MKQNGLITTGYHLPYNPEQKERARELRKTMTAAERKLWGKYLKYHDFVVLRQKPIDHYIVDFYVPSYKLVIEIDGDSHFSEEGKEYDKNRNAILQGYGLKIIRFTNDDVLHSFDGVCSVLQKIFDGEIPPTPL